MVTGPGETLFVPASTVAGEDLCSDQRATAPHAPIAVIAKARRLKRLGDASIKLVSDLSCGLFSMTISFLKLPTTFLSKRERICLNARSQKLDTESPILNSAVLTNQLIQAVFGHRAVAVYVYIHAVIGSGGLAVDCVTEANWFPTLCWP